MKINNKKIAVIGAGSWGTAIAHLLGEKGHQVNLWVYEKDLQKDILEKRENTFYLPGIKISKNIYPFNDLKESIQGVEIITLVTPSHIVRNTVKNLLPFLPKKVLIVGASKGIENESLKTVSQILSEFLPGNIQKKLSIISGPTFAKEVANKLPTAAVLASKDKVTADYLQAVFSTPDFKVFTNRDILGVEIGGSLKNVIAIAAGICDGLNLGHNARAALITRGLSEITRLGTAMGAKKETFAGLSGMGDLVLTATGDLSRNRGVGFQLGQGKSLTKIQSEMKMVAEGIKTVKSAFVLCQKFKIKAAIIEEVYYVIYEQKPVKQAFSDIMNRETNQE